MAKSSPLERTSVQLMIGAALLALLANSAVDQTDDKLPWEVTLTGFCLFAVVFAAIYAKRTEVAVSIVTIVGMIVPTYFVHYMEVPCSNWLLGSQFPLAAPPKEVLAGIFAAAPNASRYDGLLPGGLSVYHFSLFNPSMAVTANTWHERSSCTLSWTSLSTASARSCRQSKCASYGRRTQCSRWSAAHKSVHTWLYWYW